MNISLAFDTVPQACLPQIARMVPLGLHGAGHGYRWSCVHKDGCHSWVCSSCYAVSTRCIARTAVTMSSVSPRCSAHFLFCACMQRSR